MYPYYPNTRIEPEKLTDENVRRIREIYQSSGLPYDNLFLNRGDDANIIRDELTNLSYVERRPVTSRDIGKVIIREMKGPDGKKYIDVSAGIPPHFFNNPKSIEKARKKFEENMLKEFC